MKAALQDSGIRLRIALWVGALLLISICNAQDAVSPDSAPPSPTHVLHAGTEVHLRLLEPVASNTHKHGDHFTLEVAEAVVVDGHVVVPAGTRGEGEVVHGAKGGFGGRAGELILASRFLRVGDQTIKLRAFAAGNGENRVNLALGLSYVMIGLFVTGKDITLPAGTDVFAKIATDSILPSTLATGPVDSNLTSIPEQASTETDDNEISQH